ncbi:Trafficking protein particle complex subunit 10 [Liparis tanakae]|uniref:Trafficking protein particle complex subunit 10 n=1 Tax=Liparis tanakae TaxID=230148 RepID=A0A4Z2FXN1_9TELE|nr:Trafficking protein particle complex subunit 10 [Liparis tanakae]
MSCCSFTPLTARCSASPQDTEAYKSTAKEDMTRWQSSLRTHGSADWVIIVVETNDTKKKNKTNILPRSSIVDKIRSDFCNKQNDRCVVLSDPLKDSSRSQESWNSLLLKLRTLLLMSFTKNLGRFEDDMRTLREKRTQPGWSFCEYFMVQEELAFVFEMLQQFEDALVQYDELDALFTQYVLNFGAGDTANWLGSFCAPVRSWSGLLLRRPIDMEKRDGIQRGEASLLDLRSYLFSRQCTLLIFLLRPWEVTQRALELLHNCVQELRLLEVSVLEGALDCWVFLSCLEVLHRIEGCCDPAQLAANCSHTVGLWAYATDKLKSLGELCGLVSEKGPTSEDLNRTVDLLAGLGDERPETVSSLQSPYKKLKEALSSVEAFERHYLELSHAAMEMYSAIGRLRSARLVGKSLAEFYMRKGDPERAETFLQEALKSYTSEGWSLPVTHTRKQIAECQKLLGRTEEYPSDTEGQSRRPLESEPCVSDCFSLTSRRSYLQTSALLAGDANLTTEERKHFCQEILTFAGKSEDQPPKATLSMAVFSQLTRLQFRPATASVHSGAVLQAELTLRCLMPVSVRLQQLAVSIHFDLERAGTNGRSKGASRHANPGTVEFSQAHAATAAGPAAASSSSAAGPPLELDEIQDRSPTDNSLNSTGVVCKNTHLVMRRHDGGGGGSPPDTPACVAPPPVTTVKDGGQMLRPLLAGLPQMVKFTLLTGHYAVKKGDALQLSNTDSMPVLPSASCTARITSPAAELVGESSLSIQSSEKVTSISLPATPPYHTLEFHLEVLCLIPHGGERPANERLTNGEVRHRPRSYSHPDLPMTAIDQRMSIDCPWSIYSTLLGLTFYIPFKTKHTLLSAGNRKYIQVCVQNMSDVNFTLAEVQLAEKPQASLELQSLNTKTQQLLCSKHSVFCLWEVRWKDDLPSCLHVRAHILPPGGEQHCRSGFLCGLEVCITRLTEPAEGEAAEDSKTDADGLKTTKLMYEVADSSSNWAVCGKSSGMVSMPMAADATHKVQIEVMPLFAGHLPFPKIKVLKYLPHTAAVAIQPDPDSCVENDSLSLLDKALDDQGDTASIRSRGSVHSVGSGDQQQQKGVAMPRLEAFAAGQVFNHSHAQQVLVLPATDDHIMEVNAT